ncbi:MAG TPA: copper chaperone PCu(A)C [Gammaproteobacteria bacterium]|nr:copper chaperone PCu(A)C [Gammaproteobacteria bacterium]
MKRLLVLAALLTAPAAWAGNLDISHAWIRLIPGGGPSAAYLTLSNRGDAPVALVGAECAAYGKVMLHRSTESGGTSRMEHVDRLSVPPGGTRKLAPGGYHLMLMQPKDPPQVGDELAVTLHFADGTTLSVPFSVQPAYSQGPQ